MRLEIHLVGLERLLRLGHGVDTHHIPGNMALLLLQCFVEKGALYVVPLLAHLHEPEDQEDYQGELPLGHL